LGSAGIWEEPRKRIITPQSPHWLQWNDPHLPPKIAPSLLTISTRFKYTHPSTGPTHHPKRHPDPISRFATVHPPDRQTNRQTDRPTDGLGDRSVPTPAYALYIDYSDAAKNRLVPPPREAQRASSFFCPSHQHSGRYLFQFSFISTSSHF